MPQSHKAHSSRGVGWVAWDRWSLQGTPTHMHMQKCKLLHQDSEAPSCAALFICVYTCIVCMACMCPCICAHIWVCARVSASSLDQVSSSVSVALLLIFWGTVSHWAWSWQVWLCWRPMSSRESPLSASHSTEHPQSLTSMQLLPFVMLWNLTYSSKPLLSHC